MEKKKKLVTIDDLPKKKANRNRNAGHNWEREVISILHDRGLYPPGSVVTCRSNSRRLDDAGIDLMHLDEATNGMMRDSVQCKDSVSCPSFPLLLANIAKAHRPGAVLFWKQRSKAGTTGKFMERGRYAMTTMDRYLELMACERFVEEFKHTVILKDETAPDLYSKIEYNLRKFELR